MSPLRYACVFSIGSLGENGATEQVEEVHVQNCNFTGTENGARIKTVPVYSMIINNNARNK